MSETPYIDVSRYHMRDAVEAYKVQPEMVEVAMLIKYVVGEDMQVLRLKKALVELALRIGWQSTDTILA